MDDKSFEVERKRRQGNRSWMIAVVLVVLVVLFYIATIVHMGGNVGNRPI